MKTRTLPGWGMALGMALVLGSTAALPAAEPARPNFVIILIDDLGWTDVGCFGSDFYETPNIDRLAHNGLRLTSGYAACPVCSPTRASIMTGKYPARLNLTDWLPGRTDRPSQKLLRPKIIQQLPLEEVTLAEALKPAGYVSACVGKWHLGDAPYLPEQQGFDLNVGGARTGSPPGGYFKFKTATLEARNDQEYLTDRLGEEAERFIVQNRDRPFFLYLTHYAVHIPLQARKDLLARWQAKKPGKVHDNAVYAAMIQSMDESVGRVVRKLEELMLAERTLIVFTSDNGGLSVKEGPFTPATVNAPLRTGKGYLYEGGIRTPWIACWPGQIKAGTVRDVPVSTQDLYPTLLELAGVQPAPGQVIDGISLVPLFKQTGALKREALYWHYPHYSNQGGRPGGAVRSGDWKLIEWYEDGQLELYNLREDLAEKNNLAGQRPEEAARLRRLLADWRKAVNAQMPTPNPDYDPKSQGG
jgi:arylsulfatase A-like enzyme